MYPLVNDRLLAAEKRPSVALKMARELVCN